MLQCHRMGQDLATSIAGLFLTEIMQGHSNKGPATGAESRQKDSAHVRHQVSRIASRIVCVRIKSCTGCSPGYDVDVHR
jgi:hypothetical protein